MDRLNETINSNEKEISLFITFIVENTENINKELMSNAKRFRLTSKPYDKYVDFIKTYKSKLSSKTFGVNTENLLRRFHSEAQNQYIKSFANILEKGKLLSLY